MINDKTGGMTPNDPIQLGELKEQDKGRGVIFLHHHGATERGVLSSWNDHYVFCRFGNGSTAAACDPKQLVFEH